MWEKEKSVHNTYEMHIAKAYGSNDQFLIDAGRSRLLFQAKLTFLKKGFITSVLLDTMLITV